MCSISLALGGLGAVGQVASYSSQASYAAQAESTRLANQEIAKIERRKAGQYKNTIFRQDIEYAEDILDFQQAEFSRQEDFVEQSRTAINENYINQLGTLMVRAVEEDIATTLLGEDAVRQGRRQRAAGQVAAGERGVSGNTVDMLLGDVERQVGEAQQSYERNYQAINRQLQLEALGLKAKADTQLNNIPIQTFSPIKPPSPPSPTPQVQPTAPVPQPSVLGTIGSAVGEVATGYQNHYANRGQRMPSGLSNVLLLKDGPSIGGTG